MFQMKEWDWLLAFYLDLCVCVCVSGPESMLTLCVD